MISFRGACTVDQKGSLSLIKKHIQQQFTFIIYIIILLYYPKKHKKVSSSILYYMFTLSFPVSDKHHLKN